MSKWDNDSLLQLPSSDGGMFTVDRSHSDVDGEDVYVEIEEVGNGICAEYLSVEKCRLVIERLTTICNDIEKENEE